MVAREDEERKLAQQAAQYSELSDIHGDLSRAYRSWAAMHVNAPLDEMLGEGNSGFYARILLESFSGAPDIRIASFGCGEGRVEIELCQTLLHAGVCPTFECADIAPGAIEVARRLATESGVAAQFNFRVAPWPELLTKPFDVVIANQVLHHIVDLEGLFAAIELSIGERGVFLTNDMIGRNGHRLWPEALAIMDRLWAHLPTEKRFNHVHNRVEDRYANWDHSREGNEGIRAQDILSLLVKRFHFETFFACGNLAVPLFGREFGPNFDVHADRDFIDRVGRMDSDLIDCGYLSPVIMFAAMSNRRDVPSRWYRGRSPGFCLRNEEAFSAFTPRALCQLGQPIQFGERLESTDFLTEGWSSPENGGVWSNAARSLIRLPRPTDAKRLVIEGIAHISPSKPFQEVTLHVGAEQLGALRFSDRYPQSVTVSLPSGAHGDDLTIELRYSDCRSPSSLRESIDVREIAFRISQLVFLQ